MKTFKVVAGILAALSCTPAMADPVSLIAATAAAAFPAHALAISFASPMLGAPAFRRRAPNVC